jgi:DNA polymerase-1
LSKLLLIDGSGLMHRAWHSCRKNREAVGSRFFSFFRDLVDGESPTHYAIAFDPPREGLYRIGVWPEYKGHRPETPPEQREFFDLVRKGCHEAGIPTFVDPNWEADDVMGTLAQLEADEVVLCTSDKDMAQLITDRVRTYDPQQRRHLDRVTAEAVFGCRIDQIPGLLALCGDRADNIPGMPGVGRKGAQKILAELDTISEIIDSGFYEGHGEDLAKFLDLTIIRTDLDHGVRLEDLAVGPIEFQTPSLKAIRAQAAARALSGSLAPKNKE